MKESVVDGKENINENLQNKENNSLSGIKEEVKKEGEKNVTNDIIEKQENEGDEGNMKEKRKN